MFSSTRPFDRVGLRIALGILMVAGLALQLMPLRKSALAQGSAGYADWKMSIPARPIQAASTFSLKAVGNVTDMGEDIEFTITGELQDDTISGVLLSRKSPLYFRRSTQKDSYNYDSSFSGVRQAGSAAACGNNIDSLCGIWDISFAYGAEFGDVYAFTGTLDLTQQADQVSGTLRYNLTPETESKISGEDSQNAKYLVSLHSKLALDVSGSFVSSNPPAPEPQTICQPAVRGLSPVKPGDVISPGATYTDANGKEVSDVQERWYFNGVETTSVIWDGKKVSVELQWSCPNNLGGSRIFEIPAYQAAPPAQAPANPPAQPVDNPPTLPGGLDPSRIAIGIGTIIVIGVGGVIGIGGAVIAGGAVIKAISSGALPKPSASAPKPPAPQPASAPKPPSTSTAPPPPKPDTSLSPDAKKKAQDALRQKQAADYQEADKSRKAGNRWAVGEGVTDWVKSGADTGVDIISNWTGPVGKMIKKAYETTSIIVDHASNAVNDGKYKDHAIGAVSDVASKVTTDWMKGSLGKAFDWAKGKAANKISSWTPDVIKNKVSSGVGKISDKIFGKDTQGNLPDLGDVSIKKTINSIIGSGGNDQGHVRKKVWEGAKNLADDKTKNLITDIHIKVTTGGNIQDRTDFREKLSGIIQQTTNIGLDKFHGAAPKPGVEKFR